MVGFGSVDDTATGRTSSEVGWRDMRRNLGNPDAEKVLQDRFIAFFQQDQPRFLIAPPGWLLMCRGENGLLTRL